MYVCLFCPEELHSIQCNGDLRSGLLPPAGWLVAGSPSLSWCMPMLFKQNGAIPALSHKNCQFRHLLLLGWNEVPVIQLNEAELWLEPQPLTAQLSPIATELRPVWERKPGIRVCPGARPENLCDCGNVQEQKNLTPQMVLGL